MIGEKDKDQNSGSPAPLPDKAQRRVRSKTRRLTSLRKKQKKRKERIESKKKVPYQTVVSVFLSIPLVFNNTQHPPGWRREREGEKERLALRAPNSRADFILCKTE